MILTLSDILRYIVENMEKDTVPIKDELEYLRKYIELQKARFSKPHKSSI